MASTVSLDNDTWRIDRAYFGVTNAAGAGTSGTYHLDAFESRRESWIGPPPGMP